MIFLCFLFQSIDGSMVTLSRGEWMGLPDLPFKEWLKQKRRWDIHGVVICKHLEIFREPGMDFLNAATHLLWMILVRERTPSHTPKPVHSTFSDSDKVAVLLGMCPPHPLARRIRDHEFWVKLESVVTWLLCVLLLSLMTSVISYCAVSEVLLLLTHVTINLKKSRS